MRKDDVYSETFTQRNQLFYTHLHGTQMKGRLRNSRNSREIQSKRVGPRQILLLYLVSVTTRYVFILNPDFIGKNNNRWFYTPQKYIEPFLNCQC